MNTPTFKTFHDLEVWQVAREFRGRMYAFAKKLPDHEKFNLVSQMRRAALPLTNNIAEGHGRYHFQENIQYLRQSRGSLEELLVVSEFGVRGHVRALEHRDMSRCGKRRLIAALQIRTLPNCLTT